MRKVKEGFHEFRVVGDRIEDVNDHAPEFALPDPVDVDFTVSENVVATNASGGGVNGLRNGFWGG